MFCFEKTQLQSLSIKCSAGLLAGVPDERFVLVGVVTGCGVDLPVHTVLLPP
jgi:hypothetical protein